MAPSITTFESKGAPAIDKSKTTAINMDGLKYPEYYPYNDPNDIFPEPEPFPYHDRALDADPNMPIFFNNHVKVEEVRCCDLIAVAHLGHADHRKLWDSSHPILASELLALI